MIATSFGDCLMATFLSLYFRGSLYTVNTLAGEGEGECEKPDDEVLVWHRPDDFMGGKNVQNTFVTVNLATLTGYSFELCTLQISH